MLTKLRCECCDRELEPTRTGRPKRFCSSRCRTAASRVSLHGGGQNALRYRTGLGSPKSALQETDPEQEFLSRNSISKNQPLRCERVNEVTYKITAGEHTNVPACHGFWGGYRTTKALAWVMGLGHGLWQARCKDQASGPTTFSRARADAMTMARCSEGDYVVPVSRPWMTAPTCCVLIAALCHRVRL
jgi:hypothetical protein